MLKKLLLALGIIAGLMTPAYPAGTIPLSMTQQFDTLGKPLNGGRLYFYVAGTTTPQSAYADSALTIPLANPVTLDASGRVPALYLADGTIKIRLTNSAGVTQLAADGVMVIGASSGSGSGSVVDPTTVLQTGDLKPRFGTGAHTGFVRANGRTVGNAASGATERAAADCEELFALLWNSGTAITVAPGGRGATAAADWAANKTVTLPDLRGRVIAGLDDMGSSASGRLTSTYFGADATVLGQAGGGEYQILTRAQIPTGITTSGSNSISVVSTVSSLAFGYTRGDALTNASGSWFGAAALTPMTIGSVTSTGSNTITATSTNTNGDAHPIVQPTMLVTFYIKL